MKKFSLILVSALVLTACGAQEEPLESPQEVVQQAMINAMEVDTTTYEIALEGDALNEILGQTVEFDGLLSGAFVRTEADTPDFSLAVDMNMKVDDGEDQHVAAEVRLVGETLYAVLNDLTDFDGTVPVAMVEGFFDQWWSFPIPAEELENLGLASIDTESEDPQAVAMKELYENTQFFKDLEFVGNENVNGFDSYVYNFTLDKEATMEYVRKSNELAGVQTSEADLTGLDQALNGVEMSGKIFIDQELRVPVAYDATLTMDSGEGVTVNADFNYQVTSMDDDIEVEVPESSTEFNPALLFGGAAIDPGL